MLNVIDYKDIMVQQPNTNALIIAYIVARKGHELLLGHMRVTWDGSSQRKSLEPELVPQRPAEVRASPRELGVREGLEGP